MHHSHEHYGVHSSCVEFIAEHVILVVNVEVGGDVYAVWAGHAVCASCAGHFHQAPVTTSDVTDD